MTAPARRSLLFGTWCAVAGAVAGVLVLVVFGGDTFRWLPVAAAAAAFACGAALWRALPERRAVPHTGWGVLAGALAGLVAHYFTWYFQYVGANLCHWLTGGCTGSLGDPPAGLLEAFAGAAGMTFFSWLVCGWLTAPLGGLLGWLFARRRGGADPSARSA